MSLKTNRKRPSIKKDIKYTYNMENTENIEKNNNENVYVPLNYCFTHTDKLVALIKSNNAIKITINDIENMRKDKFNKTILEYLLVTNNIECFNKYLDQGNKIIYVLSFLCTTDLRDILKDLSLRNIKFDLNDIGDQELINIIFSRQDILDTNFKMFFVDCNYTFAKELCKYIKPYWNDTMYYNHGIIGEICVTIRQYLLLEHSLVCHNLEYTLKNNLNVFHLFTLADTDTDTMTIPTRTQICDECGRTTMNLLLNNKDEYGNTPLMIALLGKKYEIATYLLETNLNVLTTQVINLMLESYKFIESELQGHSRHKISSGTKVGFNWSNLQNKSDTLVRYEPFKSRPMILNELCEEEDLNNASSQYPLSEDLLNKYVHTRNAFSKYIEIGVQSSDFTYDEKLINSLISTTTLRFEIIKKAIRNNNIVKHYPEIKENLNKIKNMSPMTELNHYKYYIKIFNINELLRILFESDELASERASE